MKMLSKYILVAITLSIALFSCEKEIEFRSDSIKSQIVVNSVLRPGRGVRVKVTKSNSVLDDSKYFEALTEAKVLLFENGELLKELEYQSRIDTSREYLYSDQYLKVPYNNGTYVDTTVIISAGNTYRLEVSNVGFNSVTCETTVPLPVPLSNMTCSMKKMGHEYHSEYFQVQTKLTIDEPGDIENYYRLNIYTERGVELATIQRNKYGGYNLYGGGYYSGSFENIINLDSIQPTDTIVLSIGNHGSFFSTDPVLSSTEIVDIFEYNDKAEPFFTDHRINGQDYNISFWTETARPVYTELGEYYRLIVNLYSLSRELFLLVESREQQSLAIDNPFAEPVHVYSNVEGGMGILGSETTSFIDAVIGEYPTEGKIYITPNMYSHLYEGVPLFGY